MYKDILSSADTGRRLQAARKANNMKQKELAELADCGLKHIQALENGRKNASLMLAITLASILNTSLDYFYFNDVRKHD